MLHSRRDLWSIVPVLVLAVSCLTSHTPAQQPVDVTRLVHPEVAERLSLTEEQLVGLQQLLLDRANALAAQPDNTEKVKLRQDFDARALAILTEDQRKKLGEDQPGQRLSFQFRDMKWQQVLNWFADQQDLTLVMDRVPPGGFTYSDTRTYSPAEAIDLLNSVLLTRGFTLVRREKMLTVMELSNALPVELIPQVNLDQLPQRGRFELVSVRFPLDGRPIDSVLNEIKPYLNNYGRAIPLASGSQVLVIENAGKMMTINELIAAVPVPKKPETPAAPAPPPKPVMASYPLNGLDATTTQAFIRKLIPSENITVDEKAGILSAFVIPDQQTAIQSALNTMREKIDQTPSWQSVAYRLSKITAADFRAHVLGLAPQAKVLTTTDQGLVVAAFEDQEKIRMSLAELQVEPVQNDQQTQVLQIGKLIASQVEVGLRKFLPNSQITASDEANSVIVRGSQKDIETANEIVQIWLKSAESKQAQLRSIALPRKADAEWLATVARIVPAAKSWLREDGKELLLLADDKDLGTVETLLPQLITLLPESSERQLKIYNLTRQQRQRRANLTTSLPAELTGMTITEASAGQELLVWATERQHLQFAAFLETLDRPAPAMEQVVPQSHPLKMQDVATIMTLLASEFPEAKFTLGQEGDNVTVLAEQNLQEKIEQRIEQFNQLLPPRAEKQLTTYQVEGMTAAQLQAALAAVLSKATVQLDNQHARLLVWTTPLEHERIAETVQLLGEKPSVDVQKVVVVYPLANANATAVKTMLGQIDSEVVIVADDKLKQVAVTATIAKQAIVQSAINQMDRPAANAGAPEIRGYDVKSYQATQILPTLQSLWPDMKLAADSTSNKIIASGSALELEQFSQAIQRMLSAPAGKEPVVKTYPVPVGDLITLPAILTQIAPQSTVSTDAVSRTVTVLATEELHVRVKQAIEQLSQAAGQAKTPASYILKPTQLVPAQTALIALFPGISTAIDATTGQLVVVANPQVQQQVAAVVELLASGPNSADRMLRVFRLDPERVELTGFLSNLQSLVPSQVKLELNIQTGTLVAIGLAADLEQVSAQVDKLIEQLPPLVEKTAKIYKLTHASPSAALVTLQALVPKATLVPDLTSRTLTATASGDDHQKIDQFLKSFDLPLTPKTYLVRTNQLASVVASLRTLFPALEMASDPTNGQLVVVATDELQGQVAKVIELLINGPNAEDKIIKLFPIKRGWKDSAGVLTTLRSLIPTQVALDTSIGDDAILAIGSEEDLAKVAQQITRLQEQLPVWNEPQTVVYRLQHVTTANALATLQPLVTKATLVQDSASRTIAATAKAEDHEKIAQLLKILDLPNENGLSTRVYKLKRGSGRALSFVLREVMTDARLFGDSDSGALLASATPKQHEEIQAIVDQYDNDSRDMETRVYQLDKADARSLQTAIQEFSADVKVSSDRATNSLIVTAERELMPRVEQIVNDVDGSLSDAKVTAFYPVLTTDPTAMAQSLQVNFYKAKIVGDLAGGGIFVTATPEEHAELRKLIDQVNQSPSKLPTLRAFKVKNVRVNEVAKGLQEAFGRRSDAGVTIHEPSNSLFVVGTRESLNIAEQIVQQLDVASADQSEMALQVYDVDDIDGDVAVEAIESAFRNQPQAIEVRFDNLSDRLFVFANKLQHQQVEQLLQSLQPEPRILKVVSVSQLDPFMAKEAIDALFFDTPFNRTPRITVDAGQQQLLIKATQQQQQQIADLLNQMSVSPNSNRMRSENSKADSTDRGPKSGATSRIRFVPMQRNSERVLQDLQRVWPEIRKNPINVIPPAIQSDSGTQIKPSTAQFVHTKLQDSEDAPVVIVVGNEQWTLASDDQQALDDMERVIELIRSKPAQPYLTTGNYSVYLLQRASATEVGQTLEALLQQDRNNERRLPTSYSELARRTKIVPDTRTNALIVSGSPNDRRLIEELLGVLDSDELIGSLQQLLPTTIPLASANAVQIEGVLKTIYRSQLATSSSRRPIQIPEGVSAEITTLLQQLNAESASPLLTMTSDETTNSIIVRAPAELTQEIRGFVLSLDQQTQKTPSRRVDLIQLKSSNTEAIGAALRRLLAK